jgi:hypothetical protein
MTEPWITQIGSQPGDFRSQHLYFSQPGELEEPGDSSAEQRIVVHYEYVGGA